MSEKVHVFVHDIHNVVMQEANAINKSLTFLEQTVNALSKREGHVPFRQSKLTSLLRDALGGNCKTVSADPCGCAAIACSASCARCAALYMFSSSGAHS